MYLGLLKEKQKELFLELAYNLASIDGNYSDKEKALIEEYCKEMKMDYLKEERIHSINELVSKMNLLCSDKEKKIIVFESIGLAMIDRNYDESERKVVKLMIDTFGLEKGFDDKCELMVNEYISIQERINNLIIV